MGSRFIEAVHSTLLQHERNLALTFFCALFLFFLVYLLSLTIQYADTDLWYHLTGGRHFLEQGTLYNPFVNSYLDNPRDFTNYYWGFQVLVYSTWSVAGEFGLILLKAALFLLSGFFAARVILDNQSIRDTRFLQLFVIAMIIYILCARGYSLRPHLTSYVLIPVFIYILAYRQKLYPLLPLLTIAWVNLHGVEYVIGALICGSYFLQRIADYYQSESRDIEILKPALWIMLCLPAMMLNPNGFYVLMTPFLHDPDLGLFIKELGSLELEATIDLRSGITLNTVVLVFLFFTLVSIFSCLARFRELIAPLLIAFGALILLAMAKRFMWEWALLSTPIIAAALRSWRSPGTNIPTAVTLLAFLLLLPVTFWADMRNSWKHYPYNEESLPFGTSQFILKNNITGRYAIEPSYAGYVEFVLAPDIKIHMDMQFPPFSSMDIQEINTAMLSSDGLQRYVEKYEPDLIGVRKTNRKFPNQTAKSLGYVPVFFDRRVVLFLNSEKYPDLAQKHELKVINPFATEEIRQDSINQGIKELERMLTVADTVDVKLTLTGLLVEQRRVNKAPVYLAELEQSAPDDISRIYYAARVAHLSDNCKAAVPDYEFAISRAADTTSMHRFAAECYFLLGDQYSAYQHFQLGLNPYKDANPQALLYFQYALSAVGAGENEHARRLLTMIQRFAPESELLLEINQMLADLESEN